MNYKKKAKRYKLYDLLSLILDPITVVITPNALP